MTFSLATDNTYSTLDILRFEKSLLKALSWQINHPNLITWSNFLTFKWDLYVDCFPNQFSHGISIENLPKFRTSNSEEYFFFHNFFQIIDLIGLDLQHLQYFQHSLVLSVIYLLVGISLKQFSIYDVINDFAATIETYSAYYHFNILFNRFLNNYLYCELDDIVDHLQYTSHFFLLKFDYSHSADITVTYKFLLVDYK